jgi:TonB family protein
MLIVGTPGTMRRNKVRMIHSRWLVLMLAVSSASSANAQFGSIHEPSRTEYVVVDQEPRPLIPIEQLLQYPANAPDNVRSATVEITMLIDTSGKVKRVELVQSGGAAFDAEAERAAMLESFTPLTQNGKPIMDWYQTSVVFTKHTRNSAKPLPDHDPAPNDIVVVEKQPRPLTPLDSVFKFPADASADVPFARIYLRVLIDTLGNVQKAEIVKSNGTRFDQAALDDAKRLTFSPAIAHGKPVKVWLTLPVIFKRPN